MNVAVTIDKAANLRTHVVSGIVTKEDLFANLGALYAKSDFDPTMNILWDLRDADLSAFTLPEVVKVRDFVEQNLGAKKTVRAALVVAGELDFSLASMYETLLQGSAVATKTFRNLDEARNWISPSVPPPREVPPSKTWT